MDFSTITIIKGPLVLASEQDVTEAEAKLNTKFPAGYREYVMKLGEGELNGIRVYGPWRVCHDLESWRDRIRQYWFWDDGADVLTDEQAEESIVFADSDNGDEFIFHPSNPGRIYLLPRHNYDIYEIGNDLFTAIDWLCNSGIYYQTYELENCFRPFDSRTFEREGTERKPKRPQRQQPSEHSNQPLKKTRRKPEQVLQALFVAAGKWERKAFQTSKQNEPDTDEDFFRDSRYRLIETFYEAVTPFVSDSFDLGEPYIYGKPTQYSKNVPRIVGVQSTDTTAEITTLGNNWDKDKPKRIFQLIRYEDTWLADKLWEVTSSGRKKKIKFIS